MATKRGLGPSDRALQPFERVGFDTLADQYVNKKEALGYRFNLMCIGETSIGKATILDSLFDEDFELKSHSHEDESVSVSVFETVVSESNTQIELSLVTSTGYGDQCNREGSAKPLLVYIEKQYEAYLQEELKTHRDLIHHSDTRVHACLFLLAPTGTLMKSLDLEVLKALQDSVNIIPIIAKADTITKKELAQFKAVLRKEFEEHNLKFFKPETVPAEWPFAVIGSKDKVKAGAIESRVRQYPWGIVEIENDQHSDFLRLRELLFATHMEDLRQSTHMHFYEQFRADRLKSMGFDDESKSQTNSLLDVYERRKKETRSEIERKEHAMKEAFVSKVKEKEAELKQMTSEIDSRREDAKNNYKQRMVHLDDEEKMIEAELAQLAVERSALEAAEKEDSGKSKKKGKKSNL